MIRRYDEVLSQRASKVSLAEVKKELIEYTNQMDLQVREFIE